MAVQIQKIGIIGVGTMGAGIAQIAIQSGHDVVLFDAKGALLNKHMKNSLKRSAH